MSKTIAVLNPKGGSGKSTLSTNLARAVQLRGRSVLLVDLDPQGTAAEWKGQEPDRLAEAGAGLPAVIRVLDAKTLGGLDELAAGLDYVVLDGSAKVERLTGSAVRASDLVLIPVRPSPADLWAVADLVSAVDRAGVPAAFVVSQQVSGTLMAGEVAEALAEYGLPVLAGRTSQRQAYVHAMAAGLSVLDHEPGGKAAAEIDAIVGEVLDALGDSAAVPAP